MKTKSEKSVSGTISVTNGSVVMLYGHQCIELWIHDYEVYLLHTPHVIRDEYLKTHMGLCMRYCLSDKWPHPLGGWSFYGSLGHLLSTNLLMGLWVQRLFSTHTHVARIGIAEAHIRQCCGYYWGFTNCRAQRADGHLMVVVPTYLWVQGRISYHVSPRNQGSTHDVLDKLP